MERSAIRGQPVDVAIRISLRSIRATGLLASPNLLKRINLIPPVQSHFQKDFRSRLTQIKSISLAVSSPREGRIAIVTNAGRDAVDAAALGV
jgi:hypothetical protein